MQYKRVNARTIRGLRQAEVLRRHGWTHGWTPRGLKHCYL